MKAVTKENLKYIPFFGWHIQFLDFLMLRRDIATDADRIKNVMSLLGSYPENYWVTVCV